MVWHWLVLAILLVGLGFAIYFVVQALLQPRTATRKLDLAMLNAAGQKVACMSRCKKLNYPAPYGEGRPENADPALHACCPTTGDPDVFTSAGFSEEKLLEYNRRIGNRYSQQELYENVLVDGGLVKYIEKNCTRLMYVSEIEKLGGKDVNASDLAKEACTGGYLPNKLKDSGYRTDEISGDALIAGGLAKYMHDNCKKFITTQTTETLKGSVIDLTALARKVCCTPENGCMTSDCCANRSAPGVHGGCGFDGGWDAHAAEKTVGKSKYVAAIRDMCQNTNYSYSYDDLASLRRCDSSAKLDWVLCPNGAGGYENILPADTPGEMNMSPQLNTLRVTNKCPFDVVISSEKLPGESPTLWKMKPNTNYDYPFSGDMQFESGRLWIKLGCDANGQDCEIGQSTDPCPADGCQPPVSSKMELSNTQNALWWNGSAVDGYTIPFDINTNEEALCPRVACAALSLDRCPIDDIPI
jgi:hypothetical protein